MSDYNNRRDRDEIFSKVLRAGNRTYFFDVKETKGNDYYITLTESKKQYADDGSFTYQKHKLFLYREDFENFLQSLQEACDKVQELCKDLPEKVRKPREDSHSSDVKFEDLGS
jgi:hypothetical protein